MTESEPRLLLHVLLVLVLVASTTSTSSTNYYHAYLLYSGLLGGLDPPARLATLTALQA